MFVDELNIKLMAGSGGDGCTSFRREKFVPMGGPDGGNGGRGASIIFKVDKNLKTLVDLSYKKIIKAPKGENGKGSNKYGANAENIIISVPEGTTVINSKTNEIMADLINDSEEFVVARGGRGGKGNKSFATHDVPAPKFSEKGEPGEEVEVRLELKVLADVGLVGFPSVGKSTLISIVSKAKPKIAAYHFTTLHPNLGVVGVGDGRSFIMADLPGLIEGASDGAGLGIQFLKHIERTRVIVHIIDMSATDGRVPAEDYFKIRKELGQFNQELLKRPEIVVANKMDLPQAEANLIEFKKATGINDVIPISAYTKENVQNLLYKIADTLEEAKKYKPIEDAKDEVVEYNFVPKGPAFTIRKDDSGVYHVEGEEVKKLFDRTNFNVEANVRLFAKKLRDLGVDAELRRLGVESGDTVCVFDYEFEFIE